MLALGGGTLDWAWGLWVEHVCMLMCLPVAKMIPLLCVADVSSLETAFYMRCEQPRGTVQPLQGWDLSPQAIWNNSSCMQLPERSATACGHFVAADRKPKVMLAACACRVLNRAGGIKFYSSDAPRSLVFWTFAAACMQTYQALRLPDIQRDDVLSPSQIDVREYWCGPSSPCTAEKSLNVKLSGVTGCNNRVKKIGR